MARLISDPEEGLVQKPTKAAQYIMNSGTQMTKLKDLDRKTRHACLKMQSNIFSQPEPVSNGRLNDLGISRRRVVGSQARSSISNLLAHDDGGK